MTPSGNMYIIGFSDWYSGWPEAFAVPNKTAETVGHLPLEAIIPRCRTLLKIGVTCNLTDCRKFTLICLNLCGIFM